MNHQPIRFKIARFIVSHMGFTGVMLLVQTELKNGAKVDAFAEGGFHKALSPAIGVFMKAVERSQYHNG